MNAKTWKEIVEKVIKPLWLLHCRTYSDYGVEYEDFENMSYEFCERAMRKYDPAKSSLNTYLTICVKRKMFAYIRAQQRDRAKSNYRTQSLDSPEADGELSLGETLPAEKYEKAESNYDSVGEYIKRLSNKQRNIIILKLLDASREDIIHALGMTSAEYNAEITGMKRYEKVSKLRRRHND